MSWEQSSVLFPPASGGVLLPCSDRAAAQLGLTLYTASKRWVLAAQRTSYKLLGVFGPRILPGRRVVLQIPEWEELTASWRDVVGPVRSVARYQRKDPRAGMLLLLMREKQGPLVVKVREDGSGILNEQRLLHAMQGQDLRGVRVPRPVGFGTTSAGLTWAAQEFVFDRPHRPVYHLDNRQLGVLTRSIAQAFDQLGLTSSRRDGWVPAHGDVTPWNLRRDHTGAVWLLDWEDAGYLPPGADEAYFRLTSSTLCGTQPGPMSPEAGSYWRTIIEQRLDEGHPVALSKAMLSRLT